VEEAAARHSDHLFTRSSLQNPSKYAEKDFFFIEKIADILIPSKWVAFLKKITFSTKN